MPYYNFEELVNKRHQLQVWHPITTVKTALYKLDKLSFNDDRDEIRRVLNSISTNDPRCSPFDNIASASSRFKESLICFNMTNDNYVEIFNSLYKAISVSVQPDLQTRRMVPVCNSSFNAALDLYYTSLLRLKRTIHRGVGAYDQEAFERQFGLTWKY